MRKNYLVYDLDDEDRCLWFDSLKQACAKAWAKSTPPMRCYMVAVTGVKAFPVNLTPPSDDDDDANGYYNRCRAMVKSLGL